MAERLPRDLFPLPHIFEPGLSVNNPALCRGTKRRIKRAQFWQGWSSQAVTALNQLAGTRPTDSRSINAAQMHAHEHIVDCFRPWTAAA